MLKLRCEIISTSGVRRNDDDKDDDPRRPNDSVRTLVAGGIASAMSSCRYHYGELNGRLAGWRPWLTRVAGTQAAPGRRWSAMMRCPTVHIAVDPPIVYGIALSLPFWLANLTVPAILAAVATEFFRRVLGFGIVAVAAHP